MIKSFKHKGLEAFYISGSLKGIQAKHAAKLRSILFLLDSADFSSLESPSFRFHKLKGSMQNLYSITVQANWRITFEYDGKNQDIYIVDYQDYH